MWTRSSAWNATSPRATRAERINILAPIPGKDTVGIEIANSKKVKVTLRELLEGSDWAETKAKIPIALGKDVYGKTIIADLAAMPHCLVAGATGSGKSVCINSIISSILYRFTPEQLRFVMIDPKVVEMQIYNKLPHLVVPVVTDPKKVLLALRWVIDEMEKRYKMFAKTERCATSPASTPAPSPRPRPNSTPRRKPRPAARSPPPGQPLPLPTASTRPARPPRSSIRTRPARAGDQARRDAAWTPSSATAAASAAARRDDEEDSTLNVTGSGPLYTHARAQRTPKQHPRPRPHHPRRNSLTSS